MKSIMKKTAILFLMILLLAGITSAAAAGTAVPGGSATVSFSFSEITGIDGAVAVSGAAGHTTSVITGLTSTGSGDSIHCHSVSGVQSAVVFVQVTADSSARIGDAITVTFRYRISDSKGSFSEWRSATETVTVSDAAPEPTPTPAPPETPVPETPVPTAEPTPVPSSPVVTVSPTPVPDSTPVPVVPVTTEPQEDSTSSPEEISPAEPDPAETEPAPERGEIARLVWPILFFLSLAVNIGLVLYIVRRKKRQEADRTPLVDYDISDDI